jgi:transposase
MKPYSHDLRVRIFNYSLTHTIRDTAQIFQVSPNTVYLLRCLFNETGSLTPKPHPLEHPHLITPEGEMYLITLLIDEKDLTLTELCDRYEEAYGVRVSIGTMYNTLERLNITRKKKTFSDPKKNSAAIKAAKEDYDAQLKAIEPSNRFYLDETGSCLNMCPLYGRSKKGTRAYDQRPAYPSTTVSTVAILSEDGIKARYTYMGSLNAKLFIPYLDTFILPIFKSGQTLIMDRHPVHCARGVQKYLSKNKIKFLYLPAYSPELNPIEEAFSKIKLYIKKQKARTKDALMDVLKQAFEIITSRNAKNYFNHAAGFSY